MRPNFKTSRFLTFIKDTVATISSTVTAEFGKSLTVYVGYPGGAVGDQSDTPFLVIIPNGESLGQFGDDYSWSYTIAFCADGSTMTRNVSNEVTMAVLDKLTNIAHAFVNALNDAMLTRNVTLSSLQTRWVFEDHPLTSCVMEATFTMPNTLGISTVDF